MKILIIEDDPTLNKNICEALESEGFHTQSVFDGLLAERLMNRESFDCIVMDINLPGKNGFDLCRDFRNADAHTPVIMLTAFGELEDKVKGFDCGADDYLTKPFFMRELILRVQSLVKRRNRNGNAVENDVLVAGDITLHPLQKKVFRAGKEIELTPREFQILERLCRNQNEVVSKNEFIKDIWGTAFDTNTNTIEVYINFLRNKIDKPFDKKRIKTKVGFGYYLDTE
ncbi:MAG TPA: response regulator transcription factor [Flavobacteriaceae bacterium]|nr:response regulator transcription factor [Flavobacteriaceae bacterium]